MTTGELLALLRRHYIKPSQPLPGGVFLPEVGWNPAGGASGRDGGCDAIYVGFTSSSGRILVGHELKVSRSDWLNELNKPGKADAWADQCHQWWLVVSDPAIVHEGELPHGWGLMSPGRSKTKMAVHTKADTKTDHHPSWLAVRSIMARQDTLRAQEISAGLAAGRANQHKEIERRAAELMKARSKRDDAEELRARLDAVEEALGAPIDFGARSTDSPLFRHIGLAALREIGEAAKAYGGVRAGLHRLTEGYGNPIGNTQRALDALRDALAELREGTKVGASADGS